MLAFALFATSIGCIIGGSTIVARRSFPRAPTDAIAFSLLLCLLCLYAIPVVTGLLGVLSVRAYVLGSGLVLAASALYAVVGRRTSGTAFDSSRQREIRVSRKYGATLFALMLVLFFVYSPILAQLHRIHLLFWDVVSYALPNAVRYLQVGSLWDAEPAFAIGYPYGYELSVTWPILFFRSESLIGIFHGLFVLAGLFNFGALLCLFVSSCWRGAIVITALILLGSIPPVRDMFWYVGKNDIAVMTFGLSALYFFVRSLTSRTWSRTLAVGVSLGLMIGAKPTGLGYLAIFLVLALVVALVSGHSRPRAPRIVGTEIAVASMAVFIGCPWYLKNWILLGEPFDPGLALIGMQRSVASNLLSPQLWRLDLGMCTLALSFMASIGSAVAVIVWRPKPRLAALVFAFLGSVLLFLVTPFGAFGSVPEQPIQLRLSGIMIPSLVIIALLLPARLLHRAERSPNPATALRIPGGRRVLAPLLAFSVFALVACMYAQFHVYQPPPGLPGYEPGVAYRAVRANLRDARLWSINLRPYGLLGSDFSNYVLYGLHGSDLSLNEIMGTLSKYNIDYLLVGRDISTGAKGEFPRAAVQLRSNGPLPVVYADRQFMAFKVPSGKDGGLDCGLSFVSGWYDREESDHSWWYWTHGLAHLDVYAATEGTVTLSAELLCGPELTNIQLRLSEQGLAQSCADGSSQLGPLTLAVRPGRNRIELSSAEPPSYLGVDPRPLSFALKDTKASFQGCNCVVYSH